MQSREEFSVSFARRVEALVSRETDECPICARHVEHLVNPDGNTYAQPCSCQLWQGNLPPAWWQDA